MPTPTSVNISAWQRQSTTPALDGAYTTTTRPASNGINSITGTISNNTDVTIHGKGFGVNGPHIEVFDRMSGTVGNPLTLTSPSRGTYDYITTNPPVYEAGGRDGGNCLRAITGTGVMHPFNKNFVRNVTEMFFSFAHKWPTGSYFPSPNAATPNTFPSPSDSCLKQNWVMYTDRGGAGINDLCLMSHYSGGGTFGILGNDYSTYFQNIGSTPAAWWQWNKWMKTDFWLKADSTNPSTVNGTTFVGITNEIAHLEYSKTTSPLFDSDRIGQEPYAWDRIHFNEWCRGSAPGTVQCQYSDIYLATGPNSAARVEVGNNAVYASCTELVICPTKLWADGRIMATIQQGGLNLINPTWLFITLPDNSTRYSIQVI